MLWEAERRIARWHNLLFWVATLTPKGCHAWRLGRRLKAVHTLRLPPATRASCALLPQCPLLSPSPHIPFVFQGDTQKNVLKRHRLTAVSLFAHFAETLAHMAVNPIFSSFLIQPWLKQGGGANRSSLNFKALPY